MYWYPAVSRLLPSLTFAWASVVGTRLMQATIFMVLCRAQPSVSPRIGAKRVLAFARAGNPAASVYSRMCAALPGRVRPAFSVGRSRDRRDGARATRGAADSVDAAFERLRCGRGRRERR